MKSINLGGQWDMINTTTDKSYKINVPGTDIGNLIRLGEIENPLISGNDKYGESLGENDYIFKSKFSIDEEDLKYNCIYLKCDSLDTLCDIYVNNKLVYKSINAHIPVKEDIKQYLTKGENEISLNFYSSVNYVKSKQKENPLPANANGTNGAAYIRKPSCHFGWDWGPCVPYSGVTGKIELTLVNKEISDITIKQDTNISLSKLSVNANGADTVYILTPQGEKINGSNGEFEIKNPELWFTADLSGRTEQPLYTVVLENAEYSVKKRIGLRSIYLDRSTDKYGENFMFVLNGKRVFAKGANLIPFSAVYEDSDNKTVDYYLDLAQKSNFNILRVWGGASYANEYLMSECDRRGILIWQDFCFACMLYPFYDKEFYDNVLNEISVNVKRLTLHPSLALFCGNNEIEVMFSYMPKTNKLISSYIDFFYNKIPDFIKDITNISYIPSSPLGKAPFESCTSDSVGDTHMWSVWHGLKPLDYYQQRYTRFLSEFGLESLPSMKAISTFAKGDELNITSDSFNSHQKCTGGNKKMLFYLTEMFDMPKHFKDLPYLTGIIQAECVRNACIHFRQNPDRCNGVIFWQYNDVWNCPSWSSVDFEGVPKALQFKAKEFFEPITISCKHNGDTAIIFAHNDTIDPVSFKASIILDGREKEFDINLDSGENRLIAEIGVKPTSVMQIKYLDRSKTEVFTQPKNLKLKKADIKAIKNGNTLTLKSNSLAYGVYIESDVLPSDNYFNLAPNEERTVTFEKEPKDIKITCANNIEYKKSYTNLSRLLYRLKPENIANFVYYSVN